MGRCEPKQWALPGGLAGLFAGLLAGCVAPGEPIDDTVGEMCAGGCSCTHDSVELRLSRAEYGMWVGEDAGTSSGPGEPTGSSGDIGTSGSSGDTEAMETTGSSGDMETTGSSGGGEAFDPAALTESVCVALCKQEAGADDWLLECSVPELTPEDEVHVVCTWTTGCD